MADTGVPDLTESPTANAEMIDMESMMPGAGEMTSTYYDYGAPVTVETPSASQVREMTGIVGA